ncbi:DUF2975 family protein [Mobilisporobacter senegalensis]|uniref:DUF2975 family protein n=1 Tax=Mobilisporobacter senegalensis TaxID=1329262 RepID=A0A3N1XKY4_9FIRM|nr:DUF2975 domain-containing protein [Mobilisporobacter senegalensis]ROR27374.1 DUF2975 family protein [Mobilisporobacter senegalensis]
MKLNPLVRFTKLLLDFMFISGIVICVGVPFIFKKAGMYISIFEDYYLPYCIVFMIAGVFALIILENLRKMFKSVINEDPFIKENVISLKRMGICSFMIAIILVVRVFFVVTAAALVLVLVFIIAGLFSLVLSLVFEKAVTYKQDNDLTI